MPVRIKISRFLRTTVYLLVIFSFTGCAVSSGAMRYRKIPLEETSGEVFSQEISNVKLSLERRFDLAFGAFGQCFLPMHIKITNNSRNNYRIPEERYGEHSAPRINIAARYADAPSETKEADDFYKWATIHPCKIISKNIEGPRAYGFDMDKEGIVNQVCNNELQFEKEIPPGAVLEGDILFLSYAFDNVDDFSLLRLKVEMKNMNTGKEIVFFMPMGKDSGFKEKLKKTKLVRPYPVFNVPELRRPIKITEEVGLGYSELWPKLKRALFDMKGMQHLSVDADNKKMYFFIMLTKEQLKSTVNIDLAKFPRDYLSSALAIMTLSLEEASSTKTRLSLASEINAGQRINSNGAIEKEYLVKLKNALGLKKYEWLEK